MNQGLGDDILCLPGGIGGLRGALENHLGDV